MFQVQSVTSLHIQRQESALLALTSLPKRNAPAEGGSILMGTKNGHLKGLRETVRVLLSRQDHCFIMFYHTSMLTQVAFAMQRMHSRL